MPMLRFPSPPRKEKITIFQSFQSPPRDGRIVICYIGIDYDRFQSPPREGRIALVQRQR